MLAPIISLLRPVSPLVWLPIGLLVFEAAGPASIWVIFISAIWPIILNTAAGATWVSVHHGGGVGIGNSIHAGMVVVADGSADADERLARVLAADPGTGVMRHADAGYEDAVHAARDGGLDLPGVTT